MSYNKKCCDVDSLKVAQELFESWDARFFKLLAEPARLEIIKYLLLNGKSDIGAISKDLPQDRSVISRHLSLMADHGVLTCRKENRFRYYSVNGSDFLVKLEGVVEKLRECIHVCCPDCLEKE